MNKNRSVAKNSAKTSIQRDRERNSILPSRRNMFASIRVIYFKTKTRPVLTVVCWKYKRCLLKRPYNYRLSMCLDLSSSIWCGWQAWVWDYLWWLAKTKWREGRYGWWSRSVKKDCALTNEYKNILSSPTPLLVWDRAPNHSQPKQMAVPLNYFCG